MFIRDGTEPQFFDSLDTNLVTCKYLNEHVKINKRWLLDCGDVLRFEEN